MNIATNLYKKTNINLAETGVTELFTIENDRLIPFLELHIVDKQSATGSVGFSIGTNAPNYDDWISGISFASFELALNRVVTLNSNYAKKKLVANDTLYLKVTSAFGGTFKVDAYDLGFNPNDTFNPSDYLQKSNNLSDVSNLSTTKTNLGLDLKADLVTGKVPATQLPSYVDDVLDYANLAAFPGTGESDKIYIADDTNKTYRWSGSGYVEISASLALGETSSAAYRGDRGKTAYDHSQLTSGNPHNVIPSEISGFTSTVRNAISVTGNGNYNSSTGVITINTPVSKTFSSPTRSLNTAFQIDASRDIAVSYSVDISCALSLSGGQAGTVYLRYADDSAHTTNVKEVCRFAQSNTGTLTIGLALNQIATGAVSGIIPAGKYVKLVTENNTGTPTFTYRSGQEVLL